MGLVVGVAAGLAGPSTSAVFLLSGCGADGSLLGGGSDTDAPTAALSMLTTLSAVAVSAPTGSGTVLSW